MKRESARLAAKRHPPFFSADASCRLGKRFQPLGDELRLVSPAAFLLQRDGPAFLDAQARAPVSDALLLSFSVSSPWLGQAYARQLVGGLQVFSPRFSILLPFQKIIHGSSPLSRARFLRYILLMDGVVNFTRLCFVHAKDVYQILNIGGVQAFQIGKAGFHQRHRLFFRNRQCTRERLRRCATFCSTAVVADVSLSI